ERTRVLIHIIDTAGTEGRDPVDDYNKINAELSLYGEQLAQLPQVVAANKMDLPDAGINLERLREVAAREGRRLFAISAVTGQGVKELLYHVGELLQSLPAPSKDQEKEEEIVFRPQEEETMHIKRDGHIFIIESPRLEKLVAMTDFNQEQAVIRFQRIVAKMGVGSALANAGAKAGDTVLIGPFELEYQPDL
ncbi:MAG: Obg family GTPase CgtA, partial [bacterium]